MAKPNGYSVFLYHQLMLKHLSSGKFNIKDDRGSTSFIEKQWKSSRLKQIYFGIDKQLPRRKEKFERLFVYYWLENPKFHISDILTDGLVLYNKYEYSLANIESTFKTDLLYVYEYCKTKKTKLKNILYANKVLPIISKMFFDQNISVFSFLIFDHVFHIFDRIKYEDLDRQNKQKYKHLKIIVYKVKAIVYNSIFTDIDWKNNIKL